MTHQMHPPSTTPRKEERQPQQQQDMRHLMAQLPGTELAALLLRDAVFGFAQQIEGAFRKQVQGQRQSGQPVRQDAVVNVAAGGKVAGQGRGLFPGFAPAARVLVIAVGERLPAD